MITRRFLELHRKGEPLLLANVWDAGSARLLESLGYEALATTSSSHAGTLGRLDGEISRDAVLEHCRDVDDLGDTIDRLRTYADAGRTSSTRRGSRSLDSLHGKRYEDRLPPPKGR